MNNGGTEIYCPFCRSFKVCSGSVKLSEFSVENSYFGNYTDEQRLTHSKCKDLSFFARGRLCLTCNRKFITVEIHENVLQELIDLRNKMVNIREKANNFNENNSTSGHLTDILEFLEELEEISLDDFKPK